METGTLYIVATPIGNLEDITYRAVRILKEVDMIAAEDTRHTRKLLSHFGISRPLTSYFDHNKNIKGEYILERLREGQSIALVSDAGTPCISDPGYQLVRDAVAGGIRVVPLPGASAVTTALSASGLPTDSFAFEGFLPSRRGKRQAKLASLINERRMLVFYESPRRLLDTLNDIEIAFGSRGVVVARELTKIFEEFVRGSISEVVDIFSQREVRGEVVILVAPEAADTDGAVLDVEGILKYYMESEGQTLKEAVKRVTSEAGLPRSEVYRRALAVRDSSG